VLPAQAIPPDNIHSASRPRGDASESCISALVLRSAAGPVFLHYPVKVRINVAVRSIKIGPAIIAWK
jgi:hypothetical protein